MQKAGLSWLVMSKAQLSNRNDKIKNRIFGVNLKSSILPLHLAKSPFLVGDAVVGGR